MANFYKGSQCLLSCFFLFTQESKHLASRNPIAVVRSTLLVSALTALALAAPRPHDIEFDLVDASPDAEIVTPPADVASETVPVQPVADAVVIADASVTDVASTKEKRDFFEVADTLGKRSDGELLRSTSRHWTSNLHVRCPYTLLKVKAYISNSPDDSDISFFNDQPFKDDAIKATQPANVPQGYTLAFPNLQASSQTVSYLGLETLTSYDPIQCASICDQKKGCVAFNLYYERDPSVKENDDQCPNPPSVTNIKCVKWGVQVGPDTAKNDGQYRSQLQS